MKRKMVGLAISLATFGSLVTVTASPAHASSVCDVYGDTCIWLDANYYDGAGAPPGRFAGDNPNWITTFGAGWNDSVSSASNNGISYEVMLAQDVGYNGFKFCILKQYDTSRSANFVNVNFNDMASSDQWYAPGGGPAEGCSTYN